MTSSELLPCPFCGGKATRRGLAMPLVFCENHDCFGPATTAGNINDAIRQWNTRAPSTVGESGTIPSVPPASSFSTQAEEQVWRPIESAPRDGTRLLVCYSSPGMAAHALPVVSAHWSLISDCWFSAVTDTRINPSHWMPLPSPPDDSLVLKNEEHSEPVSSPIPLASETEGGKSETKLVYIKRWRTIVPLPVAYADEIVEALRQPSSSSERVCDQIQANTEQVPPVCDHRSTEKAALAKALEDLLGSSLAIHQWLTNWSYPFEGETEWVGDRDLFKRAFNEAARVLAEHDAGQVIANQENLHGRSPEPSSPPASLIAKGEGK